MRPSPAPPPRFPHRIEATSGWSWSSHAIRRGSLRGGEGHVRAMHETRGGAGGGGERVEQTAALVVACDSRVVVWGAQSEALPLEVLVILNAVSPSLFIIASSPPQYFLTSHCTLPPRCSFVAHFPMSIFFCAYVYSVHMPPPPFRSLCTSSHQVALCLRTFRSCFLCARQRTLPLFPRSHLSSAPYHQELAPRCPRPASPTPPHAVLGPARRWARGSSG